MTHKTSKPLTRLPKLLSLLIITRSIRKTGKWSKSIPMSKCFMKKNVKTLRIVFLKEGEDLIKRIENWHLSETKVLN